MSKLDFGVINKKLNVFNTDFMDVERVISAEKKFVYTNIPCHAVYKNIDVSNPTSPDIKPINQVIKVYYDNQFDIQNEDRIVIKKCDINNNILKAYEGSCGEPTTDMSRSVLIMQSFTRKDIKDVIPTPPVNPCNITISYKNEKGEPIFDTITKLVEKGSVVEIKPETIEGYEPLSVFVDGKKQDTTSFSFTTSKDSHNISYVYKLAITLPTDVRQLDKGLYTKDDGGMAMGLHLYAPIPILNISGSDGSYHFAVANKTQQHEDNGDTLTIKYGSHIRFSNGEWGEVINGAPIDNIITEKYIPTEEEANAYITNWYNQ